LAAAALRRLQPPDDDAHADPAALEIPGAKNLVNRTSLYEGDETATTSSAGSLLILSKTLRGAGVVDLRQERFS
jgi:hypothetical protein